MRPSLVYLQLLILLLMLCSLCLRVFTLWNDPDLHSWRIWASCCLRCWCLPLTCASGHVSIETKEVPQRMPWVTNVSYSRDMDALCFPVIIRINLHPFTLPATITIPYLTYGCSDVSQKWPGGGVNFLNWICCTPWQQLLPWDLKLTDQQHLKLWEQETHVLHVSCG